MSPGRSCLLEGPDRNPSPSPDPNPRPKPNQAAWKGPMRDMTSSRTLEVAPETAVCSNMPKRSADETCSAPPSKTSPAAASPIAVSRVLLPQPLPPSSAHRSLGMIVQSTPMIRGLEPAHTSKPRMRTAAPPVSACISGGDGGCTQPAESGCINGAGLPEAAAAAATAWQRRCRTASAFGRRADHKLPANSAREIMVSTSLALFHRSPFLSLFHRVIPPPATGNRLRPCNTAVRRLSRSSAGPARTLRRGASSCCQTNRYKEHDLRFQLAMMAASAVPPPPSPSPSPPVYTLMNKALSWSDANAAAGRGPRS